GLIHSVVESLYHRLHPLHHCHRHQYLHHFHLHRYPPILQSAESQTGDHIWPWLSILQSDRYKNNREDTHKKTKMCQGTIWGKRVERRGQRQLRGVGDTRGKDKSQSLNVSPIFKLLKDCHWQDGEFTWIGCGADEKVQKGHGDVRVG